MSKVSKKTGRFLGWVAIKTSMLISTFLSLESMYKFADMLGKISCFLLRKHYLRAMKNLNLVYGKKLTFEEKKELIRLVFRHFAYSICEIIYFYNRDTNRICDLITIEGEEHLKKALKEKKGVIMIGAHLGNFTLIELKLNSLGYSYSAFMRTLTDKKTEYLIQGLRNRWKLKSTLLFTHSSGQLAKKAFYWLKKGNIIGIYFDQKFRKGIVIDFLGHLALTASGSAIYALKTKVPVIPMFIIRQKDHTHKIFIEPPVKLENTGNQEKDIALTMTNFTKVVEKYVWQYPEQWFWLHRRWKGVNNAKKNH